MQTATTNSGIERPRVTPTDAKVPDIAAASISDTLAALHVNP